MIEISFNGALGTVGNSAILVDTGTEKILLDYGTRPREIPPKFPIPLPGKPDAVILSHCHLDHSGALPLFFRDTEVLPIYGINITKPLTELLLLDSIKVSKEEGVELPFERKEIWRTLKNFVDVNYREVFKIHHSKIVFYDAGHVPGSIMTLITSKGKHLLYTGDFNSIDTRLLKRCDEIRERTDVLITESTYSDRDHPSRKSQEKELIKIIHETLANDGVTLIAGFAIGRIAELLLILSTYGIDYPVFIDGMAKKAITITNAYKNLLRDPKGLDRALEKVKYVTTHRFRKRLIKEPSVILTTSGMCVHPDTYIQLSNGLCAPVAEVSSSLLSFDFKRYEVKKDTCTQKYYKPSPEYLYEIKTSTGIIKVTPDHKFFTLNNLEVKEKQASELKVGERIMYVKNIPFSGKTHPLHIKIGEWCSISKEGLKLLRGRRKKHKLSQKELGKLLGVSQIEISAIELGKIKVKERLLDEILKLLKISNNFFKKKYVSFKVLKREAFKRVKVPTKLTPGFCQFLGYYIGDGNIRENKKVILTDKDVKNLEIYRKLVKREFGIKGKIKMGKRNRLEIYSTVIARLINGLVPGDSRTRKIPTVIQKSSLGGIGKFLRGLFDAEGTADLGNNYIGISSVNKNIVQTAQFLLLRFGIISKMQEVFKERAYEKKMYYLNIYHPRSIQKFAEMIGFSSPSKQQKLKKVISKLKFSWSHVDIIPIKRLEIYAHLKKFFNRIPKSRELGIWKTSNQYLTFQTLGKLIKVLENYKKKINSKEFLEFLSRLKFLYNGNVIFTKILKIKKIPSDVKFVYDLSVLNNQTYIANGFVVHNCTGGPIVWYLEKLYKKENCSLVLAGWQLEGTPGKILLETGRYINEKFGLNLEIKMFVKRLDFSSHIGRSDLFKFVEKVNPEKVFCIHGDHTQEFADELKERGFNAVAPMAGNRVFKIAE